MIDFNLDPSSGVAPYMQFVHQVRRALRLGLLDVGDQLPTIKQVVARVAVNPNTVAKAYRELEREGLVVARPGAGTFVTETLSDESLAAHGPLRKDLGAGSARPVSPGWTKRAWRRSFATRSKAPPNRTLRDTCH